MFLQLVLLIRLHRKANRLHHRLTCLNQQQFRLELQVVELDLIIRLTNLLKAISLRNRLHQADLSYLRYVQTLREQPLPPNLMPIVSILLQLGGVGPFPVVQGAPSLHFHRAVPCP